MRFAEMTLTNFKYRCWSLLALYILCFCCPFAPAAEWPEFRGSTADGISTAKNVPAEWSVTEHIAWKQAIPGVGWSSPVIADGKIYLTTAVGKEAEPISL